MKKDLPTLTDSDVVSKPSRFMESVASNSRKGMSAVALAIALTTPVMGLTSCSDNRDVTKVADPIADRTDRTRADADPRDSVRYADISDGDVSNTKD